MSIDYVGKVQKITDILEEHNTTTASPDLSQSMSSRIKFVYNDDPNMRGTRNDEMPAVFVTINSASESETQMGDYANRQKEKEVVYNIYGVYNREGFSQESQEALVEYYRMAQNVEAVIKAESIFSTSAIHIDSVNTEFLTVKPENNQVKVFVVNMRVRYFYT
jgi:hypothetical protein